MYTCAVVVVSGGGAARVQYSLVGVLPGDCLCCGEEISYESGVVDDLGVGGVLVGSEISAGKSVSIFAGGSENDKFLWVVEVSSKVIE